MGLLNIVQASKGHVNLNSKLRSPVFNTAWQKALHLEVTIPINLNSFLSPKL